MRKYLGQCKLSIWIKRSLVMTLTFINFYVASAYARPSLGGGGGDTQMNTDSIGGVADNIRSSFGSLAAVITAGSYIAGMGFVLASLFKFKAHKDNPQQESVGKPIGLLMIGAAMLFLPQVFTVSGATMFGGTAEVGGVVGVTTFGGAGGAPGGGTP